MGTEVTNGNIDKVTEEQENEQNAEPCFDPETATKEQWLELLATKDAQIQQLKEKILRITAEMENMRKRLQREREEGICFANEQLLKELLPVRDNLEQALEHGSREVDKDSLIEGVRITCNSFKDVLKRFGCTAFESLGRTFDPNYHEAMVHQETTEHPENTVIQEYRKGYMLHNRLLRPAAVVVAKAPQDSKKVESESGNPNG